LHLGGTLAQPRVLETMAAHRGADDVTCCAKAVGMSLDEKIAALVEYMQDDRQARPALVEALNRLRGLSAENRAAWFSALVKKVDQPDPQLGAYLALLCGALIEDELPPELLAEVLRAPLGRALAAAGRFVELTRAFPEHGPARDADEEDELVHLGRRSLPRSALNELVIEEPAGARAFFSLETWYLPVVAAWSRVPRHLKAAQEDVGFMHHLGALDRAGGAYWMSILLGAAIDQPLVILVPELNEAYSLRIDGVCDMGQLSVLVSEPLRPVLLRLGADARASETMLRVMSGDGPQQVDASFGARFHFYDWRAVNPETGAPEDGRFTWLAPGGSGTHSLPADFQPSAVKPLGGTRVLVLVGPRGTNTVTWERIIGGTRSFGALQARVHDVQQLSEADAKSWAAAVRDATSA